jgi:prepilin-type N-terminal cleavage/methylation domain-containing protein
MVFTGQATTFAILETKPPSTAPIKRAKIMNTRRYKHGLSLVEMLIVVGIIALLATMVIGIAGRIDNQSKEKGVESTFALLEGALEEYKEFQGVFPDPNPLDTSYLTHSAALYGQLHSIPSSRKILERISDSLIQSNPNAIGMLQINDPWGTTLDYRYVTGDNFPELVSAGPDKIFGNADDITNR